MRHESVLAKLKNEISNTRQERNLTRATLKDMHYLNNVLKECEPRSETLTRTCSHYSAGLRLFPPVPVNTRTATKTTILPMGGGPERRSPVVILKGRAVAFATYSMHRRPDLFGEDAEDFRPERWDEDLPLNGNDTTRAWGFLPFSGGPRVCLGSEFEASLASRAMKSHADAASGLRFN